MSPWYWSFLTIFFYAFCVLAIIVLTVVCVKRKGNRNRVIKSLIFADVFAVAAMTLFNASHANYYKYNDWAILGKDIHIIEQKYGEFDIGSVKEEKSGDVGYFIYKDNGPIMPDHLDHYYYMQYDENGIVQKVHDGVQPGG